MKLSTRGRYALRLMLDIARHDDSGDPISLTSVVERSGLSRGYLEQLAMALRTAGLLRGVSGRYGGYRLARTAERITIGDILEATVGPIHIVSCLEDAESCQRVAHCETRLVYTLINHRIDEILRSYTLADMMAPNWSDRVREMIGSDTVSCPSPGDEDRPLTIE
jgi:Rrf2 family protein